MASPEASTEAQAGPDITQCPPVSEAPRSDAPTPLAELGDYKVWNPPQSTTATRSSLPDTYFEPTAEELKAAWQSQSRLVERLNNAPLKTQAIRDREAREKTKRWPETTIRIKFPNQLMLERKFPSTDRIKVVYAFVRSALVDEAKPNKFVLYEIPPRRELKVSDPAVKSQSLSELGLSPSSILHFSFLDESLNQLHTAPPLLPAILASANDLPPPPTFGDPVRKNMGGTSTSSGAPEEKKLPKWLKLGKK